MLKFKIVKSVLVLSNNTMQVLINETTKQVSYITNNNNTYIETLYVNRLSAIYRAIDLLSLVENKPQQYVNDLLALHVSTLQDSAQQAS